MKSSEGKGIKHTEDNLVKSYKKTKELDWDTLGIKEIFSQWLFFNGKLTGKEAEELWNKLSLIFKATLTQQRTELLEEILEHNKDDMTGLYDFDGIALEVISLVKK